MIDRAPERPVPVATYRWQLLPDAGFDAAAAAVPDLVALGISHLYLSPIAEAVPGSTHGYDAVDPERIRAELGGGDGFARLARTCAEDGLGILVDIVPNHLAADPANPWWWDVLRLGPRSRFADTFDIDWDPPKRQLRATVLLPILGDHYGRELEAGTITLERGGRPGRLLLVRYHDRTFPVSPSSTAAVLGAAARRAGDDVLGVAARVLARSEDDAVDLEERDADLAVAERTALARLADTSVVEAVDEEVAAIVAHPDRLDALLDEQNYRLARWRVGADELDYRRFFDVMSLVATRVDRSAVFDRLHALPLRLIREGAIDGLRVDHVDGLRDPAAYCRRLREAVGADTWIVVEKIVGTAEDLPEDWPVDGTTGYEVADLLGGWLTDPTGASVLTDAWRDRTGEDRSFDDVVAEARRLVVTRSLAADVERVTDAIVRVCERQRRHRDHSRAALRAAVIEIAVHAPAYRSYVRFDGDDPRRPVVGRADEAFVRSAVGAARATAAGVDLDPELFDLLEALLLGRLRGECEAEVVLRFQQFTAPVAAKGVEDTALYRWLALPHRCEVGADPMRPAVDAADWHAAALAAHQRWPRRLTVLSTHDTKRAADTRARLAALTTVPDRLIAAFDEWSAVAAAVTKQVHPADGWLLFHTLVGAFPLPLERAWPVMLKSLREAKVRTSWTDPDGAYENEVHRLVEASMQDPDLRGHVAALARSVEDAGGAAALAQLALQLLAPGVPDVYQGGEAWDLSLVDPDNRRGVDPVLRREAVRDAALVTVAGAWADDTERHRGLPRAALLWATVHLRRRHPASVGPGTEGAYVPLSASGPDASRVLAFARGEPATVAVVAARPGSGARIEADASVVLPRGDWVDLVTGEAVRAERVELSDRALPVAILEAREPRRRRE